MAPPALRTVDLAAGPTDPAEVADHMFALMLRNIATRGFVFADPLAPGVQSRPGCVIASPSYPGDLGGIDQDYVYHWTRDAALVALELAATPLDTTQPLNDYVRFSRTSQQADAPVHRGSYRIDGSARPWSDQSDGPALRVVAILRAWTQLDADAQAIARDVVATDLACLLAEYRNDTTTLWEERSGASFFARAAQLRCFTELRANTAGLAVPAGVDEAIAWLQERLDDHWDGTRLVSVFPAPEGYDPNIDVVLAALYGAVSPSDPRVLATAAELRVQWTGADSPLRYPINDADRDRGVGPLLGRYPGDVYDGDVQDGDTVGHPWAICTSAYAELSYRVAAEAVERGALPTDPRAAPFLEQAGVAAVTTVGRAATLLRADGDRMLGAILLHSDHLELSEQFDAVTGFEKSVCNLTWSYASFLSAVRARGGR